MSLLPNLLHLLSAATSRILITAFAGRSAFRHFNFATAFRIGTPINFTFFKSHFSLPPI
jgi:hypothetical protein